MTNPHRKPWEIHPGLTEARLTYIAELLVACRRGAVETHDRHAGETNWSLGCKALERSMHAILQAATNDRSWLQVIEPTRHFVFLIDGVPVRFFSGPPDGRRRGLLEARAPELAAQQLWLRGTEPSDVDWYWRISVDIDRATGRVLRVTYYQAFRAKAAKGASATVYVRNLWEVPLGATRAANDAGSVQPQAVKVPPPRVTRRKRAEATEQPPTGSDAVKVTPPKPSRKQAQDARDKDKGDAGGSSA